MILKEEIQEQIDVFLEERPDIFMIEYSLSPANEVHVVIDGDEGVSVKDCLQLSRQIENNVDREKEDYALRVSSYGASNPLLIPRQYQKNIGRKLKVNTEEGKSYKATLINANEQDITLQWKERVPKKIGKGKVTEEFEETVPYTSINTAKIILVF